MHRGISITTVVLRIVTNTAIFALLGSLIGAVAAVIFGAVGLTLGIVHGICLAKGEAYHNDSRGWFLLIVDHTWSLVNTAVGSIFLAVNLLFGNRLDNMAMAGRTTVVMRKGVVSNFATTIGPVEAGTSSNISKHEYTHVLQSRIFGPSYIPLVMANYVIATIVPYWLLYHDRASRPIKSFGDYFMRGVYPHVWNEEWAYRVEGSPP